MGQVSWKSFWFDDFGTKVRQRKITSKRQWEDFKNQSGYTLDELKKAPSFDYLCKSSNIESFGFDDNAWVKHGRSRLGEPNLQVFFEKNRMKL